jgi:hypothetical protein
MVPVMAMGMAMSMVIWRFGDLVLFLPFPPMRLPFVSPATKRGESQRIGVHAPDESTRLASPSSIRFPLEIQHHPHHYQLHSLHFHLNAFGLVHYNHPHHVRFDERWQSLIASSSLPPHSLSTPCSLPVHSPFTPSSLPLLIVSIALTEPGDPLRSPSLPALTSLTPPRCRTSCASTPVWSNDASPPAPRTSPARRSRRTRWVGRSLSLDLDLGVRVWGSEGSGRGRGRGGAGLGGRRRLEVGGAGWNFMRGVNGMPVWGEGEVSH